MSPIIFIQMLVGYAWPLWLSNVALNFLSFGRKWDRRLDCGATFFDGKQIFGPSVTLGGLALSILLAWIGAAMFPDQSLIFWKLMSGFIGHTAASFVKRRLNIEPGRYVPFLAHGDYILAFAAISAIAGSFDAALAGAAYIATIIATPAVTYCAYKLGLRRSPL